MCGFLSLLFSSASLTSREIGRPWALTSGRECMGIGGGWMGLWIGGGGGDFWLGLCIDRGGGGGGGVGGGGGAGGGVDRDCDDCTG